MSDDRDTDGPQAHVAGNYRMLEGHAALGGPQGKCRKREDMHDRQGQHAEWKHHTNCIGSLHVEDTPQKMSDHTDGLEAATVGKKIMLDGHAPAASVLQNARHTPFRVRALGEERQQQLTMPNILGQTPYLQMAQHPQLLPPEGGAEAPNKPNECGARGGPRENRVFQTALQSISQNERRQSIVGEAQEATGSNHNSVVKETATSSKPNECPDGGSAFTNALPYQKIHDSGPKQWARGDVGLKPSADIHLPKWRKCESFGAIASVAGDRSGPWTEWVGPAPV